jgi:LacI family repressor for deo operon, udp, cdd, tsx, nupC, and nupG
MTRRLADVAKYAGVSEATVSRVLNSKPGISESTRQTVLTALDVLGYDRPAKLRGERARLVGLILPELQNPIFPAFAEVVAGDLAKRGFTPVLCTRTANGVAESDYVEMLLEQHISGVLFCGGLYAQADADHDHYRRLRERRVPVVLVNAAVEDLGFPRVSVDDAHAVEQAYGHLISLGHERIGLILGPADHMPSARKYAAFMAEIAARPESVQPPLVERTMYSLEGGHAAAVRLVKRGATAIICSSDVHAIGAIRAARRLGRSVPGDISVVGFDDSAFMSSIDPPLTTMRQPIEAMGQAAVALLVGQIAGQTASSDELMFEPELVVRGSTAPARARVPEVADVAVDAAMAAG